MDRVTAGNGWAFTAANGSGEYPSFSTFATAAQAFVGEGAYALVNRRRAHKLREEAYA
jgi:putative oxidoreductase